MAHPTSHIFQRRIYGPIRLLEGHEAIEKAQRGEGQVKAVQKQGWLQYMTGWWLFQPSEKYDFVSWDDDIPNIWKHKIHVPNHQPVIINHY